MARLITSSAQTGCLLPAQANGEWAPTRCDLVRKRNPRQGGPIRTDRSNLAGIWLLEIVAVTPCECLDCILGELWVKLTEPRRRLVTHLGEIGNSEPGIRLVELVFKPAHDRQQIPRPLVTKVAYQLMFLADWPIGATPAGPDNDGLADLSRARCPYRLHRNPPSPVSGFIPN